MSPAIKRNLFAALQEPTQTLKIKCFRFWAASVVQKQTVLLLNPVGCILPLIAFCFQRAGLFLCCWGWLEGETLSPSELSGWQNMTSLTDSAKCHIFRGCGGRFIKNASTPPSRPLLWVRSTLSSRMTSTCPMRSGWRRMTALRKRRKVGHTGWTVWKGGGGEGLPRHGTECLVPPSGPRTGTSSLARDGFAGERL